MKNTVPVLCLLIYSLAATLGAFDGGAWASLGIAGALAFFITTWAQDCRMPLPSRATALLACAVLAAFAAELPLSSRPDLSLHVWAHLASIFAPLLLLTSPRLQVAAWSPRLISATALAMIAGAFALGCELASGGALLHLLKPKAGLTEYNRGIAHLVVLAFPVFAALRLQKSIYLPTALALMLLFPAQLTQSHTAKLALIVGALCAAAASYRPVATRNALAVAGIAVLGFPFYAQTVFSLFYAQVETWHESWAHRVEIWDYLSYRIMDRPVFGWGLGTTHTLDVTQPHGDLYHFAIQAAPHAHNAIIQIWVETGLVGLGFGLAFLLFTVHAAAKLHPTLRPFALGCWAAALTVSLFGFDFWTDALWSAFALSAFIFGMLQQQAQREPHFIRA